MKRIGLKSIFVRGFTFYIVFTVPYMLLPSKRLEFEEFILAALIIFITITLVLGRLVVLKDNYITTLSALNIFKTPSRILVSDIERVVINRYSGNTTIKFSLKSGQEINFLTFLLKSETTELKELLKIAEVDVVNLP